MTVTNKYVLSGTGFNLNFLLLAVQVRGSSSVPNVTLSDVSSLVCGVCCCYTELQVRRCYYISRLQVGRSQKMCVLRRAGRGCLLIPITRVPYIPPTHWNDLYQYESPPIPLHTCLYYIQKLDHHFNRIRRGSLVWWLRYLYGSFLLRTHGSEFSYCGVGGYQARTRVTWPFVC